MIFGIILILSFGVFMIILSMKEIEKEEEREKEKKDFYEYRKYIEDKIEKDRQEQYEREIVIMKANNELENIMLQCNEFAIDIENEMYKKLKRR
jgi:large-conductance mechanosensitive channel